MPERIQIRRTKGWRKPQGAIVVTRGTDWGNPYVVGQTALITSPAAWPYVKPGEHADYGYGPNITPAVAVLLFRIWVADRLEDQIRDELAGRDLACWCRLDQPCHADVLLELANGGDA